MQSYEVMILIDPEADEARQEEIVGRVRDLILANGGTWDAIHPWGRRKLAYEIDKKTEAAYWLVHFSCDAATVEEAGRVMRITDGLLRHMTTIRREETAPAEKSAATA